MDGELAGDVNGVGRNYGVRIRVVTHEWRQDQIPVMDVRSIGDFLAVRATRRVVETIESPRVQRVDLGTMDNADNLECGFHGWSGVSPLKLSITLTQSITKRIKRLKIVLVKIGKVGMIANVKTTNCKFGFESQRQDDGSAALAWWIVPTGDDNGEPIAGGYCATEADCRNDARVWLAAHREYTAEV